MKLIIGLGNPGATYAKTRHNMGQRLVEALVQNSGARWKSQKSLRSKCVETNYGSEIFMAALSESYMNESGDAVKRLVEHFEIDFKSDLLVVVDDVALPLGKLRLRGSGSDGGHRGLRSINEALESSSYARLRIGIAPNSPLKIPLEKYVLETFKAEEEKELKKILERGVEACRLWISEPLERAMNFANKVLADS